MGESIMYSHNTDYTNNIKKQCPIHYFSPMEWESSREGKHQSLHQCLQAGEPLSWVLFHDCEGSCKWPLLVNDNLDNIITFVSVGKIFLKRGSNQHSYAR